MAVEVVDAGSSVIPASVIIGLVVVGLVPVVHAGESEFQITTEFVEFKGSEVSVGATESTLVVKVCNAAGPLSGTRPWAILSNVNRVGGAIKHEGTSAAMRKIRYTHFISLTLKKLTTGSASKSCLRHFCTLSQSWPGCYANKRRLSTFQSLAV